MKIERINENSIALTMDSSELKDRNLKLTDLTYGSEKSKELLVELAKIAKNELDFNIDSPIAVEAVPLRDGNIKLIITKVYNPDELDSRFSRFTPAKNDFVPFAIMQLLESTIDKFEDALKGGSGNNLNSTDNLNKLEIRSDKDIVCIFEFDEIDKASDATKNVSNKDYESVFYKDEKNNKYFLVISIKSGVSKDELSDFNKVCNTLAEYGKKMEGNIGINKAYYDEHYKIIIKEKALMKLSML
ncbi:MAG: adaptor protein MecA [Lachnospiraceae bacterium]|nr:adaptor protein MecA [Lachnospiraceae bacterium]